MTQLKVTQMCFHSPIHLIGVLLIKIRYSFRLLISIFNYTDWTTHRKFSQCNRRASRYSWALLWQDCHTYIPSTAIRI